MPHPYGLPDLFLDRSLGQKQVPRLLRAAGLRLITLTEHYGNPADERILDEDWLELASLQNRVVFMKDKQIRHNRQERAAVIAHSVRCFCLSSQQLLAQEMADRFLRNLDAITEACQEPGPFIYAVDDKQIRRLPLGSDPQSIGSDSQSIGSDSQS